MTHGDAPQLLGRGDVAMGCESREAIRLAAEESRIQRIDTAFRFLGAYWTEALSLNRVSTPEGACELCAGLPRDLDRDALQAGGSSAARKQGTGNG